MKKVLFLSASTLLFAVAASATALTANCTLFPVTFNNGAGSGTVSCPGFTVPASILNSVSITDYADYQFGAASNIVTVTFTPTGPAGVAWVPPSGNAVVLGGGSSGAIGQDMQNATGLITAANFASGFSVNVSSAVTMGNVATSAGAVAVTYNYSSAVPEPGAMSLLGAGLFGIGLAARKFRK